MKDGEVGMTAGWNGRPNVAKKVGARVAYKIQLGSLDFDCFPILISA